MIEVQLNDPGMHMKTLKASTENEVEDILREHDRTYTLAFVRDERGLRVYRREVGDRTWNCCTPQRP